MNTIMMIARDISRESFAKQHKHAAIILRKGKIISYSVNDSSDHAEMKAIRKYKERLLWN